MTAPGLGRDIYYIALLGDATVIFNISFLMDTDIYTGSACLNEEEALLRKHPASME